MDAPEALRLLEAALHRFRQESYEALAARVDTAPLVEEHLGASSQCYQVELVFMWDDKPGGNVLVMGSIDDGGWRAFAPLTQSFIMSSDGSFVGE